MRSHRGLKFIALIIALFSALSIRAQSVIPLGGIGSVQFFDNNGVPLTNGFLYVYQAGTTTLVPVFSDATGTAQIPNPVPMGQGGRTTVWLSAGSFVKFILCGKPDVPSCAPADVLFSSDQVPIGSTSSGGGGSGIFVGTFISGQSTPATSGILRLASSDSMCFRNAANTTNICFSKNGNDLLSWAGGSFGFPEIGSIAGQTATGTDLFWADNTQHRWMMANNGGTALIIPGISVAGTAGDLVKLAANGVDLVDAGVVTPGFKFEGTNTIPVTVSNSSSLLPLQTVTIPAGDIGVAQSIFVDVAGAVGCKTGGSSITVALYLDSVQVQTLTFTCVAANNQGWTLRSFFTGLTTGASGTVQPSQLLWMSSPSFGSVQTQGNAASNNAVTINTTVSHVLQLQVTWGAADPANTITSSTMTVHRIG